MPSPVARESQSWVMELSDLNYMPPRFQRQGLTELQILSFCSSVCSPETWPLPSAWHCRCWQWGFATRHTAPGMKTASLCLHIRLEGFTVSLVLSEKLREMRLISLTHDTPVSASGKSPR